MSDVNLFDVALQEDDDDPDGYHASTRAVGPLVGATQLGLSVYELPPGQSICPYHYEIGEEEWLIVLAGRADAAHAGRRAGARAVGRGVLPGRRGGRAQGDERHRRDGRASRSGRTASIPATSVYPDSDKVGAWPPGKLFRLGDAVDYWDGELGEPGSPLTVERHACPSAERVGDHLDAAWAERRVDGVDCAPDQFGNRDTRATRFGIEERVLLVRDHDLQAVRHLT